MEEQDKQTRTVTDDEEKVEAKAEAETADSIEVIDAKEEEVETDKTNHSTIEQSELDTLQKEKDEIYQRMLRVQAEFNNFKKRTLKERDAERKYKSQDLIQELLPALDNFERALQVEKTEATSSLIDGITMVYNQLKDALFSQGVEEIATVGEEFDPNLHHAVMQVEDEEKASNVIVEELQKGYKLKDRVIRPAMVKVNK
ncbi:MAG: nucleotide exchange factor GrpE [Bacillota bacterium]|uniref:Protein GrpE n=1 Tax=Virgibacillus salarius TaxID=447199 RepID=A0A941DWP3_9BACI|nr:MULTISPECIES: nucleotide exchange factor GrpE [unclassified Virgibacillus]MBR7798185.1 nucleotide exchange factor GrpE [Virgibacillus salarius]MCC2252273.1 nucleotide exchange factor GrpE [Virgibacillus sp. AGTR]NAZ10893.1 nucleotide exchange factor GrpE [Agaribacter marinus]QRZ17464.1 nucleotide exchange factor GrpE [Virgibacillus sp. AGTR]